MDMLHNLQGLITTPKKSVLWLHTKPDGDSLGSCLALAEVLKKYGHTVDIFTKDPIPPSLQFLLHGQQIAQKEPESLDWSSYDMFWAVDMSSLGRIGADLLLPSSLITVVIDHHATNTSWGDLAIIEPKKAAAAQVLFDLFTDLHEEITPTMAQYLLTGLATDTGIFTDTNVTAEVFATAARLMQQGAEYTAIMYHLNREKSAADVQFLGEALQLLEINSEKKVAFIPVPFALWNMPNTSPDKNIPLTTAVRSITETDLGVVLIEDKLNEVRCEFRSRNDTFDVSRIALALGGGGHKAAAGARLKNTTLDAAKRKILALV